MKQSWHNLLFLHWVVDYDQLRAMIPESLEIDTYGGEAYIALVPFNMKGVTARGCPAPSALCDFPEFNVRTYVKRDGKPGVWFFSLDITNPLAVWAARTFFHLPYRRAEIDYQTSTQQVEYRSQYSETERFEARYHPEKPYHPEWGSFAHWATERYCLYTTDHSGHLYRGEIQHPQWPLYEAHCELVENTMLSAFQLGERQPALFAPRIDVVVYPLERIIESCSQSSPLHSNACCATVDTGPLLVPRASEKSLKDNTTRAEAG